MSWLAAIAVYLLGCACGAAVAHWMHRQAKPRADFEQRLREWVG